MDSLLIRMTLATKHITNRLISLTLWLYFNNTIWDAPRHFHLRISKTKEVVNPWVRISQKVIQRPLPVLTSRTDKRSHYSCKLKPLMTASTSVPPKEKWYLNVLEQTSLLFDDWQALWKKKKITGVTINPSKEDS